MDASVLISIVAIVVSGLLGLAGVILNFRKHSGGEALEEAERRTEALRMLSDEECTLMAVEAECRSISDWIENNKAELPDSYGHLHKEANRIRSESKELIKTVRSKRSMVKAQIQSLSAPEIEAIIADAYHGKKMAEAQLNRTRRSVEDVRKQYSQAPVGK